MNGLVLIVEDSPTQAQALALLLEGEGYDVLLAPDAAQGLDMAKTNQPEIVLLDVVLPDHDGFFVCQKLKADETTRGSTVIILSTRDGQEDRLAGLEVGADDYLAKPVDHRELLARLRNHMSLRRWRNSEMEMARLLTLKQVAVTVNHEINNPLQTIMSFSDYLLDQLSSGETPSDIVENMQQIVEAAKRIMDITKRLARATQVATTEYLEGTLMVDLAGSTQKRAQDEL